MALLPPPLAKITRPVPSGCLQRTRLFRFVDRNRKASPILWICGPPGCGKTTLMSTYLGTRDALALWYRFDAGDGDVAGFFYHLGQAAHRATPRKRKRLPLLTPEHMPGIREFTRHFFDDLYARLSSDPTLAFDNYHAIPPKSPIHEVIANGLSLVPQGATVLIASRGEPPPEFAMLRADARMRLLGWPDLRLTLAECREMARISGVKGRSAGAIGRLHTTTDGWAAGLALMLTSAPSRNVEPQFPAARPPGKIFDYFGNEAFRRTGRAEKRFLVTTAYLPSMTARAAQSLTGDRGAAQLLSRLAEKNYFLERHPGPEPVFQYHPLYRDFLLSRAPAILGEADTRAVKRRAAALLEENSQPEAAAELLCAMGDHESLAHLILKYAAAFLAQGRNRVLDGWLGKLPEERVQGDPWLLLWRGACQMPFGPEESRRHLEKSFELFLSADDPAGTYLSWSLIMDNLCMFTNDYNGMDEWVTVFSRISERYPSFPSPEIEARAVASLLGGLYMKRVDHPDIDAWVNRALSVIPQSQDMHVRLQGLLYLFLYHVWTGDFPKARVIIESTRKLLSSATVYPQIRILFHLFEARFHCGVAQFDHALRSARKGLEVAQSRGLHLWDFFLVVEGLTASLGKGDLESATGYLAQVAPDLGANQTMKDAYFHHLSSWHAALQGDIPLALSFEQRADQLVTQCGAPCGMAMGRLYLGRLQNELGNLDAAERHLETSSAIARKMRNPILDYQHHLVVADTAFLRGDEPRGGAALKKALGIGREHGYLHFDSWLPAPMIRLCQRALALGIEVPYVQNLIRQRNLVPDRPPFELEAWPWPLRIYTLGQFRIVRDGKPIVFSGKVQKRPLSLLKALIAFRGQAVREERLVDAVWPDAEGDKAYQSMGMALRRLRQLLGHDGAVHRQEGFVSLDPRVCWVDAFVFEHLLEEHGTPGKQRTPNRDAAAEEKALTLYRGPFLPGDAAVPWTVSMRERLRSRYLRTVGQLGTHFRLAGNWEKAREFYQKGLDVDGLAEEFYQSLMAGYLAHGRKSEALAVYERLKKTFRALGVEPSPRTRELLRSALSP